MKNIRAHETAIFTVCGRFVWCAMQGCQCMQAVVGGGAAGLVAARELIREGHRVIVFEQASQIGGVWVLDESVEDDPLGQNENRKLVHSSMYDALRVNLPRELMGYSDFPFTPEFMNVR
jgi:cation diffusion facilitator CzcD-associated flavoprotein CzcO